MMQPYTKSTTVPVNQISGAVGAGVKEETAMTTLWIANSPGLF